MKYSTSHVVKMMFECKRMYDMFLSDMPDSEIRQEARQLIHGETIPNEMALLHPHPILKSIQFNPFRSVLIHSTIYIRSTVP